MSCGFCHRFADPFRPQPGALFLHKYLFFLTGLSRLSGFSLSLFQCLYPFFQAKSLVFKGTSIVLAVWFGACWLCGNLWAGEVIWLPGQSPGIAEHIPQLAQLGILELIRHSPDQRTNLEGSQLWTLGHCITIVPLGTVSGKNLTWMSNE